MALLKVGDLMTPLRKYTDASGEEKTHWGRVGALFQRDDGDFVVKLDLVPMDGNGWLACFKDRDMGNRGKSGGGQNQGFRERDAGQKSAPTRTESDSARARPDPRAQDAPRDEFDEDIPF